jgi:hypothetical protein
MIRHMLLTALLAATIACSPAPERGMATVTADVFSGLPNPTWALGPAETTDLIARWDDLSAGPASPYPTRLGYRGMFVEFEDGSRMLVSGGVTFEDAAGGRETRPDPGRTLERWLLETGAGAIDPALLAELRAQITG